MVQEAVTPQESNVRHAEPDVEIEGAAPGVVLSPAARRALEEAAARRRTAEALPPEQGGPAGSEPTRYGDWERKGIAVDF